MCENLSAKCFQENKEKLRKISKSFERRKRKKAIIWSRTLQKSLRR